MKGAAGREWQARQFRDAQRQRGGIGGERVHVPAAPGQPAIDPVGECGGVRHGDEQAAAGTHGAADLAQTVVEPLDMFETVIGDDGVEGAAGKRETRGIADHSRRAIRGGAGLEVDPEDAASSARNIEAAGRRAEIEYAAGWRQFPEQFVHGPVILYNTRMESARRTFVLGAAAAALAPAQQRELRVAQIGIGNRGTSLLKQVLEQRDVRVAAVCDIDAGKRDAAQSLAQRDNPKSYSEFRQVLDLKDVDAVVVATPCDLHAEMAALALEAGKYVYCEKPLGITPEQVDRALKAARKSKAFLQIGQQLRYYPHVLEAIRQLHEKKAVGTPFVIKAQRNSTATQPGNERPRAAWYDDVKRSGDLIVENAVHNLDVCNWAAASRPVSCFGHGKKYLPKTIPAGSVMMDGFSVSYIYENDMHLDYSQLYLHPRQMKELRNGQWYIVFGSEGSLEINGGMVYPMWGEARKFLTPEIENGKEDAMSEFIRMIREGGRPFASVEVGATAALTAIMGREAIYRRRMVTWKELGVDV